jgi:hypothetical protein
MLLNIIIIIQYMIHLIDSSEIFNHVTSEIAILYHSN